MRRRAFTLVELLVTMAIIGILLSMMVGAVWVAQETARAEATRARVQKIHNVIIDRWEEYRTRPRLTLAVPTTPLNRLHGKREVMRLELPDRYEDLVFPPMFLDPAAHTGLRTTYLRRLDGSLRRYNQANGSSLTRTQYIDTVLSGNPHESAECLFLIVMALPADERVSFRDKDYADTNGNFMPEFIDAWGTPIHWLRWAPGVQSDVQVHNPVDYHDPFDSYGLQMGWQPSNINRNAPPVESGEPTPFNSGSIQVWGYAMLPYIYSAGADRQFGINEAILPTPNAAPIRTKNRDPYSRYNSGGSYLWRGEPQLTITGDTVHFDNITNHQPQGEK